jgi:cysteine protease IpaJ
MVAHTQGYAYSCGAACLLCAAVELGVVTFPDGSPLIVNVNNENRIYAQVGEGAPGTGLADRGYSMPARIAAMARSLGLGAEIYMRPGAYATMLSTFYSSAVTQAQQAGFTIIDQPTPPTIGDGYRDIKVMAVMKVVGLHYVLQRPDGSYMDPADGVEAATLEGINNSWFKSYADTGILIRVSRP